MAPLWRTGLLVRLPADCEPPCRSPAWREVIGVLVPTCVRRIYLSTSWIIGAGFTPLGSLQQVDEAALGARVTVDIGLRVLDRTVTG
jgi:hypothetical protein